MNRPLEDLPNNEIVTNDISPIIKIKAFIRSPDIDITAHEVSPKIINNDNNSI